MGEAKIRKLNGDPPREHEVTPSEATVQRTVNGVPLCQGVEIKHNETHILLTLGDEAGPKASMMLTPDQIGELAQSLILHGKAVREKAKPMVVLPGQVH